MKYRILGRTGLNASEIGYGGGRIRSGQDPQVVIEILHQAFDVGLNFIDTAPTYGEGTSETIIGKAISGKRDQLIITTKTEDYDPKGIVSSVEESLKRLNTDIIDILQFHGGWFTSSEASQVLDQGGLETYKKLKNQGKIRFIGFSADRPATGGVLLISTDEFDIMQIHYNLMYQSTCDSFATRGVIADAERQEIGIILMRSTTSQSFQRLMHHSFPGQIAEAEIDSFLLNYVLSNPLVDVALMSLQSSNDIIWTNAVSDATDTRIDLQKIHGR